MSRKSLIAAASGIVIALALVAFFAMTRHEVSPRSASIKAGGRAPTESDSSAAVESEPLKSSASPKAPRDTSANVSSTAAAAWATKFRASDDYLKFIVEALPAAEQGDGRAAWYIGEALSSCALVMKTYHGSADAEAQLNQQVTNMARAPQWTRDLVIQNTRRCLGLARQDPFEHLPRLDGAYTATYWHEQALAHGDPLAHENMAARALSDISVAHNMSETGKKEKLDIVATNLRAVVESRDPDALFSAGLLVADGRYSSTPLNGIAVALAACDLGRDCSADNPENAFSHCKLSGACPPDADFAYFLQQSMPPGEYAQAYARAQEIKQSVEAGDWSGVLKNLRVDRTR